MHLLDSEETLVRPAKANEVQWYGRVLRRDSDVSRRLLDFKVVETKGRGQPKMTRRRLVVEQIGIKKEETIDRKKWRNTVYELSRNTKWIR